MLLAKGGTCRYWLSGGAARRIQRLFLHATHEYISWKACARVMSMPDIAVIFELTPAPGRKQEYLDLAAGLGEELSKFDGFISIERFESITHPGRFVSLSFWRDEESVRKWRNVQKHREA